MFDLVGFALGNLQSGILANVIGNVIDIAPDQRVTVDVIICHRSPYFSRNRALMSSNIVSVSSILIH